jgi:tetratricopeptide (TPR) repeat protein
MVNPHAMGDPQVRLLSTGRERLIDAVLETLINGDGPRQHALIGAPRGFGKSFFARAVELAVRDKELPARVVILPEEQRNVSTPSGFLREIARAIEGRPASSVTGLFLDDPPEAWDEARAELDAAIDTAPAEIILIIVVENFDELIANVFGDPVDQSRLRALLADSQRLALLATSVTDKVDQDYEQRLFHAFAKFALEPWSEADHILYFERRAALDGKFDLDLNLSRVRALASFTGGAPRMAVALANLLFESDPLTAAELLDKLVDDLTPYYQALIDQMPMRTKTLFDALIRQGEPCSQSDLAARVGTTQNRIAQHFAWLRERLIVIGKRRTGGRDSLYKVADRLFVQYYRKRHLLHDSYTPLAGMAELLDGFFSAEENRRQAIRLLEQGRSEEAAEFCRAFLATDTSDLGIWARAARNQDALAGITAGLNHDHETAIVHLGRALITAQAAGDLRGAALLQGQIGIAASRLRQYARAIDAHRAALAYWEGDGTAAHVAWAMNQLAQDFLRAMQFDDALYYAQAAISVLGDNGPPDRIASLWGQVGECQRRLGQPADAITAYAKAAALWKELDDPQAHAWTLGGLGLAQCQHGRYRDAIEAHRRAIAVFEKLPDKTSNIALNHGWIAAAARQLEDHDLALTEDRAALALWQQLDDVRQQVRGESYWERGPGVGTPFVLAVADFHKPGGDGDIGSMTYTQEALWLYLFGHRLEWKFIDGNLSIRSVKADNHQYKEKMVETGFFDLEGAENISAVVFSNAGTLAKFDRMGVDAGFAPDDHRYFRIGMRVDPDPNAVVGIPFSEEVTADYGEGWSDEIQVFHNPRARVPLPLEAFAGTTQHRFEDGNHISLSMGEPVLSSNTLIMRIVGGEEFEEAKV